ncbi:hypothetical protein LINGRAHAP2_LOCUS23827 [Linum grandiflorum]
MYHICCTEMSSPTTFFWMLIMNKSS